ERLRERLLDLEVQGTWRGGIAGQLGPEFGKDRPAVREVAEMVLERGEPSHRLTPDLESREAVGNALLRVRDYFQDRLAQLTQRGPLGLVEGVQVAIHLPRTRRWLGRRARRKRQPLIAQGLPE